MEINQMQKKNTKATKVKKTTKKEETPVIDLRTQILNAADLPVEKVPMPEWGDIDVYVRSMTAKERDHWQSTQFIKAGEENEDGSAKYVMSMDNLSASTLVHVVCSDPEGKIRIFKDNDVELLGAKSASAINRLQEASRKLNGTTKEDEEALLKNLQGQDDNSG
jgi:hypothetical protein